MVNIDTERNEKGLKKFMSHPVINQWLGGKRAKKMKDGWRDLVWSFIDENDQD